MFVHGAQLRRKGQFGDIPCGRKLEYLQRTDNFQQSVASFHVSIVNMEREWNPRSQRLKKFDLKTVLSKPLGFRLFQNGLLIQSYYLFSVRDVVI
jgi:hypothetical protein